MNQTGTIVSNKPIGGGNYLLRMKVKQGFKCLPGQFVNIEVCPDIMPLLRRPFSAFYFKKGSLDIVYKELGIGTSKLAERKPGEKLSFIGPLGNYYSGVFQWDLSDWVKEMGKNIILIGGGTGAASVHFFASELNKQKTAFTRSEERRGGEEC